MAAGEMCPRVRAAPMWAGGGKVVAVLKESTSDEKTLACPPCVPENQFILRIDGRVSDIVAGRSSPETSFI